MSRSTYRALALYALFAVAILVTNQQLARSAPHSISRDYDDDDINEDASEDNPYNSQPTSQSDGPTDGYEDTEPGKCSAEAHIALLLRPHN